MARKKESATPADTASTPAPSGVTKVNLGEDKNADLLPGSRVMIHMGPLNAITPEGAKEAEVVQCFQTGHVAVKLIGTARVFNIIRARVVG